MAYARVRFAGVLWKAIEVALAGRNASPTKLGHPLTICLSMAKKERTATTKPNLMDENLPLKAVQDLGRTVTLTLLFQPFFLKKMRRVIKWGTPLPKPAQ